MSRIDPVRSPTFLHTASTAIPIETSSARTSPSRCSSPPSDPSIAITAGTCGGAGRTLCHLPPPTGRPEAPLAEHPRRHQHPLTPRARPPEDPPGAQPIQEPPHRHPRIPLVPSIHGVLHPPPG